MNFSSNNSYDNSVSYNSKKNLIPFTGSYESISSYNSIYIYAYLETYTSVTDTVLVEFSNENNNSLSGVSTETYTFTNGSNQIILLPQLKYFRINISSNISDGIIRKYNTYFSINQLLLTDNSGTLNVNVSGTSPISNNVNCYGSTGTLLKQDTSGTLFVNVSGTPAVTISGTPAVTISGQSIVSISGYVSSAPVMYDAFGRFRTSQPFTLFDATNVNYQSKKFSSYKSSNVDLSVSGTGISYDVTTSTVNLICKSTNDSEAVIIREGIYTCPYQPGKSLLIMNTFSMNNPETSLVQRVGYFNDSYGVYFEANSDDLSGTLKFVIKPNSSGTLEKQYQSSWQSFSTIGSIDVTKTQIVWFDLEWLGVGTVRAGFVIDGQFYICAQFNHANISSATYMTSAQLAPRYEIRNTSLSNAYTLKQICSTVISEGGYQGTSVVRRVQNSAITGESISENLPLVLIKLNDTISSGTQNVGINGIVLPVQIDMVSYNISANNGGVYSYNFVSIPASSISGNPSFTPYMDTYTNDNSSVMYWVNPGTTSSASVGIKSLSGAVQINGGYVSTNSTIEFGGLTNFNTQIGRTLSGSNSAYYASNILALIANKLDTKASTLVAQLGWYEL
jgi:hypothetical protein